MPWVVSRWHGVLSKYFFEARNRNEFTVQCAFAVSSDTFTLPVLSTIVALYGVTSVAAWPGGGAGVGPGTAPPAQPPPCPPPPAAPSLTLKDARARLRVPRRLVRHQL